MRGYFGFSSGLGAGLGAAAGLGAGFGGALGAVKTAGLGVTFGGALGAATGCTFGAAFGGGLGAIAVSGLGVAFGVVAVWVLARPSPEVLLRLSELAERPVSGRQAAWLRPGSPACLRWIWQTRFYRSSLPLHAVSGTTLERCEALSRLPLPEERRYAESHPDRH